jgi:hypothetical protein
MKAPRAISPDLQTKIIKLGILRSRILRTAAEFKSLSAEISAKLAESVAARP